MQVVRRDRPFYDASRGGMTLSGGEPLWQPEGARELLGIAKAEAIHTAVETCGSVVWPVIETMLSAVDLWLYDLKHLEGEAHQRLTGRGNEEVLANLERLLAVGAALALRVPVIPGRNDDSWLVERLPTWLRSHPGVREVHLMPYNRLAESKYRSLGWDYALRGVEPPPEERTKALAERLREAGVEVRVGG